MTLKPGTTLRRTILLFAAAALATFAALGCERDTTGLEDAVGVDDPIVFDDYLNDAGYNPFMGADTNPLVIDTQEKYYGTASLRVPVPSPSKPTENWAGGAFVARRERYLARHNALTFWAKASQPITLNVAGLGNDNTGTSLYEASWSGIPMTTDWQQFILPIPLAEKLGRERGLLYIAEGAENSEGYTIWFDEVVFDSVSAISNPRPEMATQTVRTFSGSTVTLSNGKTIFRVRGVDQTIDHMPGYFTLTSSDENVVQVVNDELLAVGGGTAIITAMLGKTPATGQATVHVTAPPSSGAPRPTVPAGDVISMFSNAYQNITVDSWSAVWDLAEVTDYRIGDDDIKIYTNLQYAGIEFSSNQIDATDMTHFHMDVWIPEGQVFKIKLVDFGEDGAYGGGDDSQDELVFTAASTPALETGKWVGFELPLEMFSRLTGRANLAQLIISGQNNTAYVDNIYFHK